MSNKPELSEAQLEKGAPRGSTEVHLEGGVPWGSKDVRLEGGAPWGFRFTGGAEHSYPLKVSRVNPGSQAAELKVREGDLISSINGFSTATLTNQEAHSLIKDSKGTLLLTLAQKSRERRREGSADRSAERRREGSSDRSAERRGEGSSDRSDKQLNKDKPEPSTDKGKETNALTEITCNPNDNHNHLGKNEELLGLVLQSKPEKKFERVKFTFLHRPSKSEINLPLPSAPETVILRSSRLRKASLTSQEETDYFNPEKVSTELDSSLDQTASNSDKASSNSDETASNYEQTASNPEQKKKQQDWFSDMKKQQQCKLKGRLIKALLEKGLKQKEDYTLLSPTRGRKLSPSGKKCERGGNVGSGRNSPQSWSPSAEQTHSSDYKKGSGRIEDYEPTDEDRSETHSSIASPGTSAACTPLPLDTDKVEMFGISNSPFSFNKTRSTATTPTTPTRSTTTTSPVPTTSSSLTPASPSKKYVHEILCDGEGETSLVIRKSDKTNRKEKEGDGSNYRSIQNGGEIPQKGLGRIKTQHATKKQHFQAGKEDVNIHFKAPIPCRSELESLSDQELQTRLEKKMLSVYEEMAARKLQALQEDYEKRKHSDYRVPCVKKIPGYRMSPNRSQGKQRKPYSHLRVKTLYNFQAQSNQELSFAKGSILEIIDRVDENWLTARLAGRQGIVPIQLVDILPDTGVKLVAEYSFRGTREGELTIVKGETLAFHRLIDDNWVEVSLGDRCGIVPLQYLSHQDTIRSWEDEVLSLGSSPSTPHPPPNPNVLQEHLYRPSDLAKSRMREEFRLRELEMNNFEHSLANLATNLTKPEKIQPRQSESQNEKDKNVTETVNKISSKPNDPTPRCLSDLPLPNEGLCDPSKSINSPNNQDVNKYSPTASKQSKNQNSSYVDYLEKDTFYSTLKSKVHPILYDCVMDHEPGTDVELLLKHGDRVLVLQDFCDGWMAGSLYDPSQPNRPGLFPSRCVRVVRNN